MYGISIIMSKSKPIDKDQIIEEYLKFLNTTLEAPLWVYQFIDNTNFSKDQFYQCFDDINGLEREVWNAVFIKTVEVLEKDPTFLTYGVREKMLAFYYTLIEVMNERRDALRIILSRLRIPGITPSYLSGFKSNFESFTSELLVEGTSQHEVASRGIINRQYPMALWQQCLFLIRFWKKDRSEDLSATDEAIERATNLGFDLMGPSSIDGLVGFGKFIYQSRKKD